MDFILFLEILLVIFLMLSIVIIDIAYLGQFREYDKYHEGDSCQKQDD